MEIVNLEDRLEFLDEVISLEHDEWASNKNYMRKERIKEKKQRVIDSFSDKAFCKLLLIDNNELLGFISLFPKDAKEEPDLSPWFATIYVKSNCRGKGYSKLLADAIINEARNRGFKTLYLKTELDNYYEKFGAKYMKMINDTEKLYKIVL